jgi:dihydrofolate reductase
MRKLIAGMKISVDGKMEAAEGMADWVAAWSDDYGVTPQIDACLLGGGMYPAYEQYWTSIQKEPDIASTGLPASCRRRQSSRWARFAAGTPHYVLSGTLTSTNWPQTRLIRTLEDIEALKRQPGKDIYLIGGARTTASLIDAGLVEELRLIVYPLIVGPGKALFATTKSRRTLELRKAQQLPGGLLSLVYGMG